MGIGSGGRGKNSPLHTFWANTLRAEFLNIQREKSKKKEYHTNTKPT
jgi:hypothetical protein